MIMTKLLVAIAATLLTLSARAAEPVIVLENGPIAVTDVDFKAAMTRFPKDLRDAASAQSDVVMRNIDALFTNRTLAAKAVSLGLDKDPLVQQRLKQIDEAYLAHIYVDHLEETLKVPALEVRAQELYRAEPGRFTQPALARLQHIVVSHMNRTPEMSKARALEARAKLVAGSALGDVSMEYSDGPPMSRRTGDLGEVRKADLDGFLADPAFTLPVNQWSEPIVTPTATHLILVKYRKPERLLKFEEVKASILEEETEKLRKQASERAFTAIRGDQANKIYPDRAEALRSKFDPTKIDNAQRAAIKQIEDQKPY